jgi:predicted alpha/beta hydrolase
MTEQHYLPLTLITKDDTAITARHYVNAVDLKNPRAILLMAGATGVPQRFYKHYALAANQCGFDVVTLDYRGIGESAPVSLIDFKMNYLDWAYQDLATAVDYIADKTLSVPQKPPLFIVGHSFGGHALGLLPNLEKISGAYVFGVGAGWHGWMPILERIKVWSLWHLFAPILVKIKGYLAWSALGMGEDLPFGVYRDWKYWCGFPHYFFDDPKMAHVHAEFARCHFTIVAQNAIDDLWAQPRSRDAFFKGYCNATLIKQDLVPTDFGLKTIDHMGYFKKNATQIWQKSFDWFNQEIDKLESQQLHRP